MKLFLPLFLLSALCATAQVVIQDNAPRRQDGRSAVTGCKLTYFADPESPQRAVGTLLLEGNDTELLERFTQIAKMKDEGKAIETLHRWQDALMLSAAPDPRAALNINWALASWYGHECDREPEFMAAAAARYLASPGDPAEHWEHLAPVLRLCPALHLNALSALKADLFRETGAQETGPKLMLDPAGHAVELMLYRYSDIGRKVHFALHDYDFLAEDFAKKGLMGWQYVYGKSLPPAVQRAMHLMAERRKGYKVTAADLQSIRRMAKGQNPALQGFIPRCLLALDPACKPWAALNDPAASLFLMPDTSAVTLPQWDDALFGPPTTAADDIKALSKALGQTKKLGTLVAFSLREAEQALPKNYLRAHMGVEGYDEFTTYMQITLLRDGIDIVNTPQGPRFSMEDKALQAQSRALQLALHRCILKLAILERDGKSAELQAAAKQLAAALNRSNAWPLLINEYELRGISPAALHALVSGFRGTPTVQRALATTLLGDRMMRHLIAVDTETDMASPTFLGLLDPARSEADKQKLRAYVYDEFAKACGWPKFAEQQPESSDPRVRELAAALLAPITPDRWLELVRLAPGYRTERFNLLCGDTMPMAARRALMEKLAAEGHYESAAYMAEMLIHRACVEVTPGAETGSQAAIAELRRQADAWHEMALKKPSDEAVGMPASAKVPPSDYPSIQPGLYEWHFTQKNGKPLTFRAGILSLDTTTSGYEPEQRPLKLRKEDGQEITVPMGSVSEEDYENINQWYEHNDFQVWSENTGDASAEERTKSLRARVVDRFIETQQLYNLPGVPNGRREKLRYLMPGGFLSLRNFNEIPDELKQELEERHIPLAQGETELRTMPSWWVALAAAEQDCCYAEAVFLGRRGGEAESLWNKLLREHPEDITGLNHTARLILCYQDEKGNWDANARDVAANCDITPKAGLIVSCFGAHSTPVSSRFWVSPADAAAERLQKDFLHAIENRQTEQALKLLEQAPGLAACDSVNKGSALGLAAERGLLPLVKRMLQLGARPMSKGFDPLPSGDLLTALELSAAGGPEVLHEMMQAAGLTVAQAAEAKLNPYMGIVEAQCDGSLKPDRVAEAVAQLRNMGFDINAKNDKGMSALQYAVNTRRLEAVRALMLAGADSRGLVYQGMGNIPVGLAGFRFIDRGDDSVPRELRVALIESGYDVNVTSPQTDLTMLSMAMEINDVDMVKLLLEHGAKYTDANGGADTLIYPISLIRRAERDENKSEEEVQKTIEAQLRIMELLLEHGADVNARVKAAHGTVLDFLHIAKLNDPRAEELLLRHGAEGKK